MASFRCLLLLTLALAGCATGAADRRAENAYADLQARSRANLRAESCDDGAPFGATCGLLMDRATHEDFRTSFREKRCQDVDTNACQARFDRALDEWLAERYYAADFRKVAATCGEHPGACDSPTDYERLLLQSHNRFVKADTERAAVEIRSDLEEGRARERAETAEAAEQAVVLASIVLATHGHCHPHVY